MLLEILSIANNTSSDILETGRYMPGHVNTPGENALQKKVESFGNLLCQWEEHWLTHIYEGVFLFCEY
jgi:hypothetical protein